jgi:hypothetical protein
MANLSTQKDLEIFLLDLLQRDKTLRLVKNENSKSPKLVLTGKQVAEKEPIKNHERNHESGSRY